MRPRPDQPAVRPGGSPLPVMSGIPDFVVPHRVSLVGVAVQRRGRTKRRVFSNEFNRRTVAEYDDGPNGAKGAVLRRERLYDSHV